MKRSPSAALLAVFAAVLAAPAFAAGPLLEKEVDVPRATRVDVGLVWEKCTLVDVESHNGPDDKMVEAAKAHDPKDLTFLLLRFRYANSDWIDHRVRLTAVLLDGEGNVVGDASRTATMDKGQKDDTISFPMKIKTVDWPVAKKLRVTASFLK
ncbi:MAG TPA: hypothetical protein PLB01_19055 [Thermoanaerobaculia bacterium]|nr:hypothetical protein [Thermoanaerobaculia bacterium]